MLEKNYEEIVDDERQIENAMNLINSYKSELIIKQVDAEEQGDTVTVERLKIFLKEVRQDFLSLINKEVQIKVLSEYPRKKQVLQNEF